MKVVIIFGPPAVGKMTVGQSLAKVTDFKIFHNHMSIELALNFFEYGTKSFNRIDSLIRKELFKEIAASDLPGLIFTFVWALDLSSEKDYLDNLFEPFTSRGVELHYVELHAPLSERLERNKTENRLLAKPSKRDLEWSEKNVIENDTKYVLNSNDEYPFTFSENYVKIDNSNLTADAVAEMIRERFEF